MKHQTGPNTLNSPAVSIPLAWQGKFPFVVRISIDDKRGPGDAVLYLGGKSAMAMLGGADPFRPAS